MPQRRCAIKALRQNWVRKQHNTGIKSDLKKITKKFLSLIQGKNHSEATGLLKTLFKKIDKAVKRNILPKNTAARRKSKYSKLLNRVAS